MTLTTALAYIRVSTEDQAREGMSLETQLAECQRYAIRHEWILGATYTDVLSGTRDDRPQYQQMLADVRQLRAQGIVAAVVVAALDRFGRRVLERVRCREELKALGVATHSVREGGEVSDLVANILAAVAQEESRRMGERVRATRAYIRERGFAPPGKAPWGYLWRPATQLERIAGAPRSVLDVDHDTAPYVREAFERCETTPLRKVARWLQELPPAARQNRTMAISAFARAIESVVYIARDPAATGDVLASPVMRWPALVDDAQWLRVQQGIAGHRILHRQATSRYLLTGFLRCPRCGGRVTGRRADPHHRNHYQCSRERATGEGHCQWHGPAHLLEGPVLLEVRALLAALPGSGVLAATRRAWQDLQQPGELDSYREGRAKKLRHDADRLRKSLAASARMFVDGEIDRAGYELVRDACQAELAGKDEELARLSGTTPPARLPDWPAMLLQIGGWDALLTGEDIAEQRQVLAALVTRVEARWVSYGRYTVTVTWTALGEALALVQAQTGAVRTLSFR